MSSLFTDRLLIYVDNIDKQHRKIFQVAEEFSSTCNTCSIREDKIKLVKLFKVLKSYTEQHFEEEKEYMIKYEYPEYLKHIESHNVFLRKLHIMDKSMDAGYIPITKLVEINEFFTEGFVKHLSEEDSKLGEFLRDKLVKP